MTPKTQAVKEKKDTFNLINIKNFCASMDTIQESEKTIYSGENIYKSNIR